MSNLLFKLRYRKRIVTLSISNLNVAIKMFEKPLRSVLKIMLGKYPVTIRYRDGNTFTSYDPFKFFDEIRSKIDFTYEGTLFDQKVKLIHAERGEVKEVFESRSYSILPVKDEIVIDIGANIGDSCIYFALSGAKHVYAFEIVPSTFEICRENIKINNLESKITVMNVGIGKKGFVSFPRNFNADGSFTVSEQVNGEIEVEVKSLSDVLDELRISSAVMKIDCEGCEYRVFIPEEAHALKKVKYITGEFHYGYRQIESVLAEIGFIFSHSKEEPFISQLQSSENPYFLTGLFTATKKVT